MATRLVGQLDPNGIVQSSHMSPSNDVWTTMSEVINEWGITGQQDLWDRLIQRQEELLKTGAVSANLFQQLNFGVRCPCIKDETRQVNQRCQICYGSLFVGGYEKFGFNTIFITAEASSVGGVTTEDAGGNSGATIGTPPTLTNIVIKKIDMDTAEIAPGATIGIILSPAFQILNNVSYNASNLVAFDGIRRLTQNQIKVEFTTDGGETFMDLFDPVATACLNAPAFNIQYRITLTRPTPSDPSPIFKILRSRFQMAATTQILISKKTFPEQRVLESFGVRVGMDGITWWTTPFMGVMNGKPTFIQENDIFEITKGRYVKEPPLQEEFPDSGRFKPANVSYVEPFGRFISQRFNIRPLQLDEPGNSVF